MYSGFDEISFERERRMNASLSLTARHYFVVGTDIEHNRQAVLRWNTGNGYNENISVLDIETEWA